MTKRTLKQKLWLGVEYEWSMKSHTVQQMFMQWQMSVYFKEMNIYCMHICWVIKVWRNWLLGLKLSVGHVYTARDFCPWHWTHTGLPLEPRSLKTAFKDPWDHSEQGGSKNLGWDGTALALKMWQSLGQSGRGEERELVLGFPWSFQLILS